MDIKRYARFEVPGHALTGERSVKSSGAGWEYSHSIVDDHSRLAYAEILGSQGAEAVLGFIERAPEFFEARGITVKRLMTDNAWACTRSRKLARLLRKKKIRHVLIKPRRPQTNGKVKRFQGESSMRRICRRFLTSSKASSAARGGRDARISLRLAVNSSEAR